MQGVCCMYAWYAGSLPHFFCPALSSMGTPDTCKQTTEERTDQIR